MPCFTYGYCPISIFFLSLHAAGSVWVLTSSGHSAASLGPPFGLSGTLGWGVWVGAITGYWTDGKLRLSQVTELKSHKQEAGKQI